MQITETSADGLKREFKVIISAKDIDEKVNRKLEEIGRTTRMPGFRPGKVPMPIVKQRYGMSVLGEVLEEAVAESSGKALSERGLKPAMQPKIEVTKFEEGSDLEYTMGIELLPDIEPVDFAGLEVERLVADVDDKALDEALERIGRSRRTTRPLDEPRPAQHGDTVVINFDGSVDGERLPGMKADDHHLELGSGSFVDTFEEQLVGASAGDHRTVSVTFPADYPNDKLAGKEAVFEVDVKEIQETVLPTLDDEFAKGLGLESLDELKTRVKDRLGQEYADLARARVKRTLLDKLSDSHDFPVPGGMVEVEFEAIWSRLQEELKRGGLSAEESGRNEDEIKAEYRQIAERRVRLGLLLSEVGRRNNIKVSQEELNRAMVNEARQWPGQERQVFEFFKNNPQALDNLRAPIFEDKVVDFILELAKISEKKVSVEELARDPDEAEDKVA